MAELNMGPMIPKLYFVADGGSYYKWFPTDFPLLAQTNVAAGRLILHSRGFAVPHYADTSKIGYVLQGDDGVAGLVFPNNKSSGETVVKLKKGDLIPVPAGVSSWWFNNGDSDLEIIFLGDTKTSLIPGDINYFVLTGPLGILQSFSPDYVARTYNLNGEETDLLLKSQTNGLIFKLEPNKSLPQPKNHSKFVFTIDDDDAAPDHIGVGVGVKPGGSITTVTESKFPFIGESGLTAILEKLDANAVRSPVFGADSSPRLIYIVEGSGKIQIVGLASKLDVEVKAGQLLVVPKYCVIGKVAGEEGLVIFSVITTTHASVGEFGGKSSVLRALSPEILEASFNITTEFEKLLRSKIVNNTSHVSPNTKD